MRFGRILVIAVLFFVTVAINACKSHRQSDKEVTLQSGKRNLERASIVSNELAASFNIRIIVSESMANNGKQGFA